MYAKQLPALALVAMLAAASIEAQTLSRAEAGRVAVANCYATCMDRAQTTSLALYARGWTGLPIW